MKYKIVSNGTKYGGSRGMLKEAHEWKQIAKHNGRKVRFVFGGTGIIPGEGCVLWVRWHNKGTQYQELAITQNWVNAI